MMSHGIGKIYNLWEQKIKNTMEKFESIIKLIKENLDDINFGDFAAEVWTSDLWINKAQQRLNVIFPPSYVWWLKNYGGGEIMGEEVFSVYEKDNVVGGDIVYINELNRKNKFSDNTQLVIQETDRSEMFYFDLLQRDQNGEYPVYRLFLGNKNKYADDFLGFLAGRILDKY
jgi:hypothetical protein